MGYLYHFRGKWHVRYRALTLDEKSGKLKRKQVSSPALAEVSDTPREKARKLADEYMYRNHVSEAVTVENSATISQFFEREYTPYLKRTRSASTFASYRTWFIKYIEPYVGNVTLREFKTRTGEVMMTRVAQANQSLAHTSLKHVKSVLGGMFTYARRMGAIEKSNPMTEVEVPRGMEGKETEAYSLAEAKAILNLFIEGTSPRVAIAIAMYSGLSKAEIQGLEWSDIDKEASALVVRRNRWKGIVKETKTRARRAEVPMIRELERELRAVISEKPERFIVPGDLDGLARYTIAPALERIGMRWKGWHAFRRGLATNLHSMSVDDVTIQRILRHSDVSVTRRNYIKSLDSDVREAMSKLDTNEKREDIGDVRNYSVQ